MGLIKSTGNMYDFVDYHWNIIKGECNYRCKYCYVRSSKRYKSYSQPPYLDLEEVKIILPTQRHLSVFIGSKTDMWAPWIPEEFIKRILEKCFNYPFITFFFQSKNPARFFEFLPNLKDFRGAVYLGTTIETDRYPDPEMSLAPTIYSRVDAMKRLGAAGQKTFVTIEPIMKFNLKVLMQYIGITNPDFLTIGADSKGHGLVEPTWPEIQELIEEIGKMEIEIRKKPNLDRIRRGAR